MLKNGARRWLRAISCSVSKASTAHTKPAILTHSKLGDKGSVRATISNATRSNSFAAPARPTGMQVRAPEQLRRDHTEPAPLAPPTSSVPREARRKLLPRVAQTPKLPRPPWHMKGSQLDVGLNEGSMQRAHEYQHA